MALTPSRVHERGETPAVVDYTGHYSRSDILQAVEQLSQALPKSPKQRFMVFGDTAFETLVSLLAIWREGHSAVMWRQGDLGPEYIPNLTRTRKVVRWTGRDAPESAKAAEKVFEVADLADYGIAASDEGPLSGEAENLLARGDLILSSSGSTGQPKCIVISNEGFIANGFVAGNSLGLSTCNLDYWVFDTDLGFTSGVSHLLMGWTMEIPVLFTRGMEVEVAAGELSQKRYGFGGSPLAVLRLIETCSFDSYPVTVMTSGDFLRSASIKRMSKIAPDMAINMIYGLTEVSGRACFRRNVQLDPDAPLALTPLPGISVKLISSEQDEADDVGIVHMRTPYLMQGYLLKDGTTDATKLGEWWNTSDRSKKDKAGGFVLEGRQADVFKVGGEQVNRVDIEKVLSRIMTGFDYAVIPGTHEVLGQIPVMVISAPKSADLPHRHALIGEVKESLSQKHIPFEFYRTHAAIPRTKSGKLKLRDLVLMLQNHKAGQSTEFLAL